MTETRDYDEAGRLLLLKSTQSSGPVASFGYTYDANGNRATLVETRTGASPETTTYGYDDANRLVAVAYPEETVLYSLDAVGNRKGEKKALPGVVAALTVAAYAALSPAKATNSYPLAWLPSPSPTTPTATESPRAQGRTPGTSATPSPR